jgi:hypothetical protein
MLIHFFDAVFLFQLQPGRGDYSVADAADDLRIGVCTILELVQRVLKLVHQLACQVRPSFRQARSLQVGYDAYLVPARVHRDLGKVPPGTGWLWDLFLDCGVLFLVGEPVVNEPWEAIVLDQAHHVEVEVPAVSGSGS